MIGFDLLFINLGPSLLALWAIQSALHFSSSLWLKQGQFISNSDLNVGLRLFVSFYVLKHTALMIGSVFSDAFFQFPTCASDVRVTV